MMHGHIIVSLCLLCKVFHSTLSQDIDECTQGTHSCNANADCTNTIGSYTCKCKTGYTGDGSTCSDVNECSTNGDNCHNNADCSNTQGSFICTCKPGYTGNGVTCSDIDECEPRPCMNGGTCANLINAYSCSCPNGYSGKNCQVASLGVSCSQSGTTCADRNAGCQSNRQGGNTCRCTSSYYDSDGLNNIGGTCILKVSLGSYCPMQNACLSFRAECVGSKCRCTDTYYDTNTDNTIGGSCETRRNLGASCSSSQSNNKQCIDQNASCRGWPYICSCDDRYHQDGSSCKPNVALGGSCQGNVNIECSDPNAECIKSKCTCNVGYYRFYEGNSQSNCRTVRELQVTGITFPKIKTTEFTVSWTAPTSSSYLSGYDVEWQSGGKVVDATSPQRVTGLTPGRTYEVKVISKDTATEPGVTRTTYTSKQQSAKSSIPGAVTSSENDLDASDGNIDIKWTAGTGVTTLYRIKLFDGDYEKGSRDASSLSTTFNNVLNGYRYNVRATARSQQFNGDYLWSEAKVSPIKTKVQVPQSPRNGVCKSPTDSAITLDWNTPSLRNGDLVRYHIVVLNTSNDFQLRDKTTGTETEKVVGMLRPAANYIFRLYTENEGYNSTNYDQISSSCKTRAKMSDSPTKLAVTGITSRGFDIFWEKPRNTYSEENYGYVLQIKDETDSCWEEVIYRCSDCRGSFILSNLTNLCDPAKRDPVIDKTKQELASKLTYTAVLHPDIVYTVSVTAINDAGRGHPATYTQRTNEEAPQKPYQVSVTDINSISFVVNWEIGSPRPGNTTYTIKMMTDMAESKELNVVGYENRKYLVLGLEEFWNYTITVTASTSIGSLTSDMSDSYRTLPAAPGKVSSFSVQDGQGQTLKISWKTPNILERNSKIKEYRFKHNATGDLQSQQTLNHNGDENYEYSISLDVVPETFYYFEVFAINEQNMNGEKTITIKQAHAKVPVNIEETLGVDVIPLRLLKDIERTQFSITLLKEFFEESTNGEIKATGIIACVKDCNLEDIQKVTDFDTMKTWKQFTDQGPGFYRVTSPSWFDEIQTFCNTGRKKRSIKSFEYTLGSEYCTFLPADEYCNGPLQPGTSYKLVAVVCNIGGCLLSRHYGPFITAAAARVIEDSNCSTQSIVIGVVLGLIILVLLVYAGYTTITLRRIRSKDGQKTNANDKSGHISQTYANEAFGSDVTRRDYGNPAGQYSESEYHTLDSNTREDKTTYDTLRNSP